MRLSYCTVIIGLMVVLAGCSLFSKKQAPGGPSQNWNRPMDTVTKYILADNLAGENVMAIPVCILADSSNIYLRDSTGKMIKTGVLYLGDTLSVANSALMPFMNIFYSFQWHGRAAYVYGTNLGYKNTDVDFDGDGRTDTIIYGYTDYDTSSREEVWGKHPLCVRFQSSTGAKHELSDTGYSEIVVQEFNDSNATRFSKPTKILDISSGYPACGYPQFHLMVAFRDGKMAIVDRYESNMDSGYGNYFETILPTTASNHPDTIYLVEHLNSQTDENPDTIITSSWDSSIIYFKGDKWATNTFWKAPDNSDSKNQNKGN